MYIIGSTQFKNQKIINNNAIIIHNGKKIYLDNFMVFSIQNLLRKKLALILLFK